MPKFHFGHEFVSVREGIAIEIAVLKSGEGSGSVWVSSSSRNGVSGACEDDYEPVKELLRFSEWEDCKKVTVKAKSDLIAESNEYFTLQLLAVQPDTLATPNTMTIEIIDMPVI